MNNKDIDKLIATEVMGWELKKLDVVDAWIDKEGKWTLKQMWKPTTDIRDAWEVLETVDSYSIGIDPYGSYGTTLYKLNEDKQIIKTTFGIAKTAPLAICYAALKAKGITYE